MLLSSYCLKLFFLSVIGTQYSKLERDHSYIQGQTNFNKIQVCIYICCHNFEPFETLVSKTSSLFILELPLSKL